MLMNVLGIESSCDETAAAVVQDGHTLLGNVVASSMQQHARYGGIVPEIAARSHIESVLPVIDQAVRQAFPADTDPWSKVDAMAVTQGAGLGGSLLVGVLTARTLAISKQKALYALNHVHGHLYANFITGQAATLDYALPHEAPPFPLLGIIVSGGHSQLVLFRDHFDYTLLGQTQDDAIGEAYDKVGKILGLPYPGGPNVDKCALDGNPQAFALPKARLAGKYDFSFSGLKTAVLRAGQASVGADYTLPSFELASRLSDTQKADIAASFQRVACETIVDKAVLACQEFAPRSVIVGGGVASNPALRQLLAERLPVAVSYTDRRLCTDNAAMIAALGGYAARYQQTTAEPATLVSQPNLSM